MKYLPFQIDSFVPITVAAHILVTIAFVGTGVGCAQREDATANKAPAADAESIGASKAPTPMPVAPMPEAPVPKDPVPKDPVPKAPVPKDADLSQPAPRDLPEPPKHHTKPDDTVVRDMQADSAKASNDQAPKLQLDSSDPVDGDRETQEIMGEYVAPDQRVREAMLPPADAKRISRKNHLWIDGARRRVYADGYVAARDVVLEMFACPAGTKEHESIVATLAKASEVHAALLAIGAQVGTPVKLYPKYIPPTGQVIRVWVCWRDEQGEFQTTDARQWIQNLQTEQPMTAEWVFAGSGFWKDPSDGREYYQADGGDMICVSNFSSAMLDVSIASSAEADQLLFKPITDQIPERGTPVRVVLVPLPNPTDSPADSGISDGKIERDKRKSGDQPLGDLREPPTEEVLPPLRPLPDAESVDSALTETIKSAD